MEKISRWFLLIALLISVPLAHADGTTAATLQSPSGLNDGGVHVSSYHRLTNPGPMDLMNTKSAGQLGQTAPQTHGEADGLSTQFVSQRHNNRIVRPPHRQGAVVTAPEPSMLLMLGAGLAAVGFFTRRKLGNPLSSRNLV